MSDKQLFDIKVTYFKPSGKYYTHTWYPCLCDNCDKDLSPDQKPQSSRCCYMFDVIKDLKARQATGKLPGLTSGRWDGHIVIDCDVGFPVLILQGDLEK